MDFNTILLVLAALLPAVILCIYVFKKDRVEKEPIGLLLLLFGLGALSCFPAAFIEGVILEAISAIFSPFAFERDGQIYMSSIPYYLFHMSENFIGIALVEEALKWIILILVTRKNKNFNHLFDGIIYAVFVSLGFAALENVMYVTSYGFYNAITRGVLSVPGHMFNAVFMGYYYSFWNINCIAREQEKVLAQNGLILMNNAISPAKFLVYSLLIPVMTHGFYDYALSIDTWLMTVLFLIFIVAMYIYCFGKIKFLSNKDAHENNYAFAILFSKYPTLKATLDTLAQSKSN